MENLWIIYGYGWWFFAYPSENMSSSIGMIIPNIWKTCSKPPTSVFQLNTKNFVCLVVWNLGTVFICPYIWGNHTDLTTTEPSDDG